MVALMQEGSENYQKDRKLPQKTTYADLKQQKGHFQKDQRATTVVQNGCYFVDFVGQLGGLKELVSRRDRMSYYSASK